MAALLVLYIALIGWRAVQFIASGEPAAIGIGIALLVFPALGLWALARELLFGLGSQRLLERMAEEGSLPVDDLPKRASGRPIREYADEEFPRYRDAVQAAPEDWRAWFRLGLAYDASGDRRRARQAVRQAIGIESAERRAN
ncbi:hypothetical protein ACFSBZ_00815 [Amnibacterium flavum]|nr:hypothetical protein [Amnibacterium flavum]